MPPRVLNLQGGAPKGEHVSLCKLIVVAWLMGRGRQVLGHTYPNSWDKKLGSDENRKPRNMAKATKAAG